MNIYESEIAKYTNTNVKAASTSLSRCGKVMFRWEKAYLRTAKSDFRNRILV